MALPSSPHDPIPAGAAAPPGIDEALDGAEQAAAKAYLGTVLAAEREVLNEVEATLRGEPADSPRSRFARFHLNGLWALRLRQHGIAVPENAEPLGMLAAFGEAVARAAPAQQVELARNLHLRRSGPACLEFVASDSESHREVLRTGPEGEGVVPAPGANPVDVLAALGIEAIESPFSGLNGRLAKVTVKPSALDGAGRGLFAAEDLGERRVIPMRGAKTSDVRARYPSLTANDYVVYDDARARNSDLLVGHPGNRGFYANHDWTGFNAEFVSGKDGFHLKIIRPVRKGEEIRVHYGDNYAYSETGIPPQGQPYPAHWRLLEDLGRCMGRWAQRPHAHAVERSVAVLNPQQRERLGTLLKWIDDFEPADPVGALLTRCMRGPDATPAESSGAAAMDTGEACVDAAVDAAVPPLAAQTVPALPDGPAPDAPAPPPARFLLKSPAALFLAGAVAHAAAGRKRRAARPGKAPPPAPPAAAPSPEMAVAAGSSAPNPGDASRDALQGAAPPAPSAARVPPVSPAPLFPPHAVAGSAPVRIPRAASPGAEPPPASAGGPVSSGDVAPPPDYHHRLGRRGYEFARGYCIDVMGGYLAENPRAQTGELCSYARPFMAEKRRANPDDCRWDWTDVALAQWAKMCRERATVMHPELYAVFEEGRKRFSGSHQSVFEQQWRATHPQGIPPPQISRGHFTRWNKYAMARGRDEFAAQPATPDGSGRPASPSPKRARPDPGPDGAIAHAAAGEPSPAPAQTGVPPASMTWKLAEQMRGAMQRGAGRRAIELAFELATHEKWPRLLERHQQTALDLLGLGSADGPVDREALVRARQGALEALDADSPHRARFALTRVMRGMTKLKGQPGSAPASAGYSLVEDAGTVYGSSHVTERAYALAGGILGLDPAVHPPASAVTPKMIQDAAERLAKQPASAPLPFALPPDLAVKNGTRRSGGPRSFADLARQLVM